MLRAMIGDSISAERNHAGVPKGCRDCNLVWEIAI